MRNMIEHLRFPAVVAAIVTTMACALSVQPGTPGEDENYLPSLSPAAQGPLTHAGWADGADAQRPSPPVVSIGGDGEY